MSEKKKSRKGALAGFWVRLVCFVLIAGAVLIYGSYVLTPKQEYGICPMTNLYMQPRDTVDVLVIGTSLAYSGCNTNVLWSLYGIASYDLCGAEQPFWETYYLLREALTLQSPQLIVLDAKAASYTKNYSTRARTIQHTFGILNPIHRTEAIFGCQEKAQDALGFVLAYPQIHNRYSEIKGEDFVWPPSNQGRGPSWKGFIETDIVDPHERPYASTTSTKSLKSRADEYVRKIFELAQAEEIPIVVVAFPNPDYANDALYYNSLWKVADEYSVPYINYNDSYMDIGLDYSMDFADWQHLNIRGGIKMGYRLGKDLRTYFHIPDRRGDPAYESYDVCLDIWKDKMYTYVSSPQKGEYNL